MFKPKDLERRWLFLIGGDLFAVLFAAYAAWMLHQPRLPDASPFVHHHLALSLALLYFIAIYFVDLYNIERPVARSQMVVSLLLAALTMAVVLLILVVLMPARFEHFAAQLLPRVSKGWRYYLSFLILSLTCLTGWRLFALTVLSKRMRAMIMVAGTGERAKLLAEEVRKRSHLGYKFLGFVSATGDLGAAANVLAAGETIHKIAAVDQVAPGTGLTTLVIEQDPVPFSSRSLLELRLRGTEVIDFESFYERLTGKLAVPLVSESWLALAPGFRRSRVQEHLKRLIDIAGVLVLASVTWPIALAAALAIRLDSNGPLCYSQDRVGLNGKIFRAYKFRSMYLRADQVGDPGWTLADDTRITRVGRIIRRLHIDELPQLFNVLIGDMSLVGPRAERAEIVAEMSKALPLYGYRHAVRPGLTGWAQVCYRYGASHEDYRQKLSYELYYVKNWSLTLDLQIILQTVKVVLFGRGSR